MQLNNTKTGHFILIDKIIVNSNKVIFSEYEAKGEMIVSEELSIPFEFGKKQKTELLTSIKLEDYLKLSTNFYELCYTKIKEELELTDYEISEDSQCWLKDRPARIIIESAFAYNQLKPIDAIGTLSPVGEIIKNEKVSNFGYYYENEGDNCTILYINSVASSDYSIIEPYLGSKIFVENRIIE